MALFILSMACVLFVILFYIFYMPALNYLVAFPTISVTLVHQIDFTLEGARHAYCTHQNT